MCGDGAYWTLSFCLFLFVSAISEGLYQASLIPQDLLEKSVVPSDEERIYVNRVLFGDDLAAQLQLLVKPHLSEDEEDQASEDEDEEELGDSSDDDDEVEPEDAKS